ncbi:MAG: Lpg1974 family pore-forming outer membrane protein [Chlamydiota bacterium]
MKKIILPLSICLTQIAIANTPSVDNVQPMVNLPARPSIKNGQNLWIQGEFLYWQATECNLAYIYSGTPTTSTPEFQDIHYLDFEWDPGFRVGVGGNFTRDGWDIAIYYTRMHSHASASRRAHGDNDGLFQIWSVDDTFLTTPLSQARGSWHADLNQVDLQLGREMFAGKYLTLRPYIGMRSTWLSQQFNVSVSNTLSQSQHAKMDNRFWGFGFVAGMDSDWIFGKGFSLFANADYSLLVGFFSIDEKSKQDGTPIWRTQSGFRAGRSIIDIAAGFKWAHLFCKDRYGVAIKAGYEYHLYFDQNQLINTFLIQRNAPMTLERYLTQGGNLTYQGITVGLQFDF